MSTTIAHLAVVSTGTVAAPIVAVAGSTGIAVRAAMTVARAATSSPEAVHSTAHDVTNPDLPGAPREHSRQTPPERTRGTVKRRWRRRAPARIDLGAIAVLVGMIADLAGTTAVHAATTAAVTRRAEHRPT